MADNGDNSTFTRSIYVKYFDVVNDKGNNLYVKCNLCGSSRKPISTAKTSTSNLKKHMEVSHSTRRR
jgi:hypothetical protein